MRRNRWIAILLVFVLSGCSLFGSGSSALYSGDYAAILPYEDSDTRVKHVSLISDLNCRVQIEQGLMDLSKDYFSPSDVSYKTHAFLDYDELDATDGSRGLLGTLRDDNPIGLNPSSDEEFDTGNGISTGPVILVDIYELDWYSSNELKGISLSLVLNGSLYLDDGSEVDVESAQLDTFFEVTANKLVSYMRERFNEVTSNVPIYVTAYKLSSDSDTYGGYIQGAYFASAQGVFSDIDEQWVLMPSNSLRSLDSSMADEFLSFKKSIINVLTDYTYVVGEARYNDKKPSKINITITTHAKTAGEILAVAQMARESMSLFTNTNCRYNVTIINNDQTYVIIQRLENSRDCDVISTL